MPKLCLRTSQTRKATECEKKERSLIGFEDRVWVGIQYIREKIAYCKKNRLRLENGYMKIIPISFGQSGPAMIARCQMLLDNEESLVVINPKFQDLIIGLRGAVSMDGRLIKEESPNHDLIDGFRLAANYFTLEK